MTKTMGKYCKAYPITRLRAYPAWSEKSENVRPDRQIVDGKEVDVPRELTEEDHLYLQENYVVTDGIFKDENVIFDDVTPEWQEFCEKELGFEIPDYARDGEEAVEAEAEAESADGGGENGQGAAAASPRDADAAPAGAAAS